MEKSTDKTDIKKATQIEVGNKQLNDKDVVKIIIDSDIYDQYKRLNDQLNEAREQHPIYAVYTIFEAIPYSCIGFFMTSKPLSQYIKGQADEIMKQYDEATAEAIKGSSTNPLVLTTRKALGEALVELEIFLSDKNARIIKQEFVKKGLIKKGLVRRDAAIIDQICTQFISKYGLKYNRLGDQVVAGLRQLIAPKEIHQNAETMRVLFCAKIQAACLSAGMQMLKGEEIIPFIHYEPQESGFEAMLICRLEVTGDFQNNALKTLNGTILRYPYNTIHDPLRMIDRFSHIEVPRKPTRLEIISDLKAKMEASSDDIDYIQTVASSLGITPDELN